MLTTAAVRMIVCSLAATLSTCSAVSPGGVTPRPALATVTPTPAPAEEAPRMFDPDVVRSDPSSPVGQVRAALDAGDPERAQRLAAAALVEASGEERHRLAWLAARAARRAGTPAISYAMLAAVADSEHPLAPWARLERSEIMLQGDAALAAIEVAPLTELEWAGAGEARDIQAAALVASGDAARAEPLLRALLAEAPAGSARASVAMPLAELLVAKDEDDAKIEALSLFRRVATRAPLSSAGRDAEARASTLLSTLPAARRRALRDPSPEQAIDRAEALASANQFVEAEAAFAAAVDRTEDEALRCRGRLGQGRAIYYRRERRRAADFLADVARDCDEAGTRAWARYLAGKGFFSAGEPELALAQYARLEEEVPQHSLADDARYRSALIDLEGGDEASAVRRLNTLPTVYPEGDMRGRARFMLAWRARRGGQLDDALAHLDATIAEGEHEEHREDLPGRAPYWRACVLAELDRDEEARAGWASVVRDHPLSYYSQQALVRLSESSPAAAAVAHASLGRPPEDARIAFAWRDELDTAAFSRALELLIVGEVEKAQRELAWLTESSASASTGSSSDDELRWLEAALMDRAGAYPEAVYITRRHLRAFMDRPPAGDHYARWRIAYPRAYASAIEDAARDRPIPAALLFAIAREESSFRPDAVSVAHAYGLTQLIVPTARRFGRGLGVNVDAQTLTDPAINVQIGAGFMSWLWTRYETNPVVLPSAYNAGQGATDRWLRERPTQRLDEWIEEIPYDETRRYTRRVLQTWGIYAWLDRGELPPLRAELPPG